MEVRERHQFKISNRFVALESLNDDDDDDDDDDVEINRAWENFSIYKSFSDRVQVNGNQPMVCGLDAAHAISSRGPFNVSVSNLQLGPFLGYRK